MLFFFFSKNEEGNLTFSFDRVFGPESNQQILFDYSIKQTVEDVFNGYNGTVFAYGQTGSGKTYTMMGPDIDNDETRGVIPRIVQGIFNKIDQSPNSIEYFVKVSYMEIYMEKIRDLLDPTKKRLQVHEDKINGVHVKGLTGIFVSSVDEVYDAMKSGGKSRAVAHTNMNAESSRSHSILQISIKQEDTFDGKIKTGKLFLVDLAGSEKLGKTGATGQTLEEAKKINKSLSALGNVINSLTDGKSTHIPYRDSKLTRILQESLGGNSRTTLIINCSPSSFNSSETISTLRFGTRAKSIKNKAKVNQEYSPEELKLMVKKLNSKVTSYKAFIKSLEDELKIWRSGGRGDVSNIAPSSSSNSPKSSLLNRQPEYQNNSTSDQNVLFSDVKQSLQLPNELSLKSSGVTSEDDYYEIEDDDDDDDEDEDEYEDERDDDDVFDKLDRDVGKMTRLSKKKEAIAVEYLRSLPDSNMPLISKLDETEKELMEKSNECENLQQKVTSCESEIDNILEIYNESISQVVELRQERDNALNSESIIKKEVEKLNDLLLKAELEKQEILSNKILDGSFIQASENLRKENSEKTSFDRKSISSEISVESKYQVDTYLESHSDDSGLETDLNDEKLDINKKYENLKSKYAISKRDCRIIIKKNLEMSKKLESLDQFSDKLRLEIKQLKEDRKLYKFDQNSADLVSTVEQFKTIKGQIEVLQVTQNGLVDLVRKYKSKIKQLCESVAIKEGRIKALERQNNLQIFANERREQKIQGLKNLSNGNLTPGQAFNTLARAENKPNSFTLEEILGRQSSARGMENVRGFDYSNGHFENGYMKNENLGYRRVAKAIRGGRTK
ncbi:Kinesin heavy chain [Smittium culicis]|uniref:Kinesin-like protein n=1 Tax=Smittium culicis TaxID=133412 RepID=A0A1R1X3I0_9FUNG|nr:Kinesin heavy chain [Smittium culicis]OMJ19046.1 Kinesin heavy chain [Smittium culicis]